MVPTPKSTCVLYAPAAYWKLPESERARMGCGPGYIGDLLIPDRLWGLSIRPCCSVHDFMYRVGETEDDRSEADDVFVNNALRLILAGTSNKFLLRLRLRRARTYYQLCRWFGGPAFWSGKNLPSEEREVAVL